MDFEIFKEATPTNWKQENAMNAMFKDRDREFDYRLGSNSPECEVLLSAMKQVNDSDTSDSFNFHRFYFKTPPSLGDVMKFKNASLVSLEWHYDHITFHIKFDVENPFIEEIASLAKECEDAANSNTIRAKFDRLHKIDTYIPDFTYAYSYNLSPEALAMVVAEVAKPEVIAFAKRGVKMTKAIRDIRASDGFNNMNLEQRKKYWKLNNQYDDMLNGHTPTEEEKASRQKAQDQSEEEYKRKNDRMISLLKEIDMEETLNKPQ